MLHFEDARHAVQTVNKHYCLVEVTAAVGSAYQASTDGNRAFTISLQNQQQSFETFIVSCEAVLDARPSL